MYIHMKCTQYIPFATTLHMGCFKCTEDVNTLHMKCTQCITFATILKRSLQCIKDLHTLHMKCTQYITFATTVRRSFSEAESEATCTFSNFFESSLLGSVAVCCSVMQCVAVCCSVHTFRGTQTGVRRASNCHLLRYTLRTNVVQNIVSFVGLFYKRDL